MNLQTTSDEPTFVTVVTGANSGIGRAIAIHLASHGHTVYGTVRALDRAAKLTTMAADAQVDVNLIELEVTDDDSVRAGFAQVLDDAGRIDVLVNNAGIGGNGTVEETTIHTYAEVMDVDLYGQLRCLQAVLPSMRQRRRGTIVNITSVVGRVAALAQAPYVASKWALEGVSEELAHEVAPFGIRVVIIEPGITKSAIFARNADTIHASPDYEPHLRRMAQFYAAGYPQATDPFEVAKVVHHAIHTDKPTLRHAVSWGGAELIAGRSRMSDEQWIALGAIHDDDAYYQAYADTFGLDISVGTG